MLDRLDTWLAGPAVRRLLLWAPAGRGKSALVVRWLNTLSARCHLVFVPISVRFSTNRPELIYHALSARLADLLRADLPAAPSDPVAHYRGFAIDFMRRTAELDQPMLLVVDGLDEAAGWRFDEALLPASLPPSLRVLISARLQDGDIGAEGWLHRLGWDQSSHGAADLEVTRLTRCGIADILGRQCISESGLPADVHFAGELDRLSGGDPLLVSLYLEELQGWRHTGRQETVDALATLKPGFAPLFRRWLDDQERLWRDSSLVVDRDRVDLILALLACALGPLHHADLAALCRALRGPSFTLPREALKPLARFLYGDGGKHGYVLNHPKYAEFLRKDYFLDPAFTATAESAYLDWGMTTIANLNDGSLQFDQCPTYLLIYLHKHMQLAEMSSDAFFNLTTRGWRIAWAKNEGGHRGYSIGVRAALKRIGPLQPDSTQISIAAYRVVFCVLSVASVNSVGREAPPELLKMALDEGVISLAQALDLIDLKDAPNRMPSRALLVPHLLESDFTASIEFIQGIDDSANAVGSLLQIARNVTDEQREFFIAAALRRLVNVPDPHQRAAIGLDLAAYVAKSRRSELLKFAKEFAQSTENFQLKSNMLFKIASLSKGEEQADIIEMAMQSANQITIQLDRAFSMLELTPLMSNLTALENLQIIGTIASSAIKDLLSRPDQPRDSNFEFNLTRTYSMYYKAMILTNMYNNNDFHYVMDSAILNGNNYLSPYHRFELISDILSVLPSDVQELYVDRCEPLARDLDSGNNQTHAFLKLAKLSSGRRQSLIKDALRASERIDDQWSIATLIIKMTAAIPEGERLTDLKIARDAVSRIGYVIHRSSSLQDLSLIVPEHEREAILYEAYNLAAMASDPLFSANALNNLLSQIPSKFKILRLKMIQAVLMRISWIRESSLVNRSNTTILLLLGHLARVGTDEWTVVQLDNALSAIQESDWALAQADLLVSLAPIARRLGRSEVAARALSTSVLLDDPRLRAPKSYQISSLA